MDEGVSAQKRFGSTLFWRLFALINLITVGWVGWVIWQLTPHPVVNDFVLRLPVSQRRAIGTMPVGAVPGGEVSGAGVTNVPGVPGVSTVTPVTPPALPVEIPLLQSGPPMTPLKLETEIKTSPKPVK